MKITHRPSGSMCHLCVNKFEPKFESKSKCPNLHDYKTMKKIKTDKNGVIVVKCEGFEREN